MIGSWLRHRRQLAVARRAALLRAEIASLETKAAECDKMAANCRTFEYEIQAGNMRGEAARLRVKLGHVIQYEDPL